MSKGENVENENIECKNIKKLRCPNTEISNSINIEEYICRKIRRHGEFHLKFKYCLDPYKSALRV